MCSSTVVWTSTELQVDSSRLTMSAVRWAISAASSRNAKASAVVSTTMSAATIATAAVAATETATIVSTNSHRVETATDNGAIVRVVTAKADMVIVAVRAATAVVATIVIIVVGETTEAVAEDVATIVPKATTALLAKKLDAASSEAETRMAIRPMLSDK